MFKSPSNLTEVWRKLSRLYQLHSIIGCNDCWHLVMQSSTLAFPASNHSPPFLFHIILFVNHLPKTNKKLYSESVHKIAKDHPIFIALKQMNKVKETAENSPHLSISS